MLTVDSLSAIIARSLPEPHAGLLSGILFGIKSSLTPQLQNSLIRSGTLHIVALSGMNISIIATLVASTLLRAFSRRVASLLTILAILVFVWFVGPSPSVIRAATMASLALLAVVLGRPRSALFFLILTSIIMIIAVPSWLTNISFQLSFLSTLGIILFTKDTRVLGPTLYLEAKKPSSQRLFLEVRSLVMLDLRTSLAAQVFTLPLMVFVFHQVSFLSPLANVLISPVIGPLTVLGFLFCLVATIYYPFSLILGFVCYLLIQYILTIVFFVSSLPFSAAAW